MAIEIKFNTKIRLAVELINNGDVNPILDFNDTRYSLDVSGWSRGVIKWTPFSIALRTPIGENSYTYPYAAHNLMSDALLGPSGITYPSPIVDSTFPAFPTPPENGFVIP